MMIRIPTDSLHSTQVFSSLVSPLHLESYLYGTKLEVKTDIYFGSPRFVLQLIHFPHTDLSE